LLTKDCEYQIFNTIFGLLKTLNMQKITPPPQGYDPKLIQAKLQALKANIEEYQVICASQIQRVTIVVQAFYRGEIINRVFSFPPGTIPLEINEFFESSANRMCAEMNAIEEGFNLYRIGNHIVEFNNFIKDYTAGEIPSIDGLDIQKMQNMEPGQKSIIDINNKPTPIERIS